MEGADMAERAVREIIRRSVMVTGTPRQTVHTAARAMAEHRCGSIVVLDRDRLVGIFTERDLLSRVVAAGKHPARTHLAEVMTRDPDTIAADADVAEAIRRMDEGSFRYLPVMEGGRLVGMISAKDLPYAAIGELARELDNRHDLAERML
jgi:CBS domain-containing protein